MRRLFLVALVVTISNFLNPGTHASRRQPHHNNHQPKLTVQQSNTTNGLVAVSPVNSPRCLGQRPRMNFHQDHRRRQDLALGAWSLEPKHFSSAMCKASATKSPTFISPSGIARTPASTRRRWAELPGRCSSRIRIRTPSTIASPSGHPLADSHRAIPSTDASPYYVPAMAMTGKIWRSPTDGVSGRIVIRLQRNLRHHGGLTVAPGLPPAAPSVPESSPPPMAVIHGGPMTRPSPKELRHREFSPSTSAMRSMASLAAVNSIPRCPTSHPTTRVPANRRENLATHHGTACDRNHLRIELRHGFQSGR